MESLYSKFVPSFHNVHIFPSSHNTPLYSLLRFAIFYRILILGWGTVMGYYGQPYDTSLSITNSHILTHTLASNNISSTSITSTTTLNHTNLIFSSSLSSYVLNWTNYFTNWDSVYFLYIAQYGYNYAQFHAFFPLYPLLISFIR